MPSAWLCSCRPSHRGQPCTPTDASARTCPSHSQPALHLPAPPSPWSKSTLQGQLCRALLPRLKGGLPTGVPVDLPAPGPAGQAAQPFTNSGHGSSNCLLQLPTQNVTSRSAHCQIQATFSRTRTTPYDQAGASPSSFLPVPASQPLPQDSANSTSTQPRGGCRRSPEAPAGWHISTERGQREPPGVCHRSGFL